MKGVKMILFLACFFSLLSFLAAQEIELNFPENVVFGEEFEVNLNLLNFSDDVYDVKIDILGGGTRLSKIWNGDSWQSTYNYVEDAIDFPSEQDKVFRLNITEDFSGIANIEVKIRDSSGGIEFFEDYQINIDSASVEEESRTYFELDWDEDDIINGETFKIEIKSFNLDNNEYDIRIWIEEDGNVISDRYDKDEWKSGSYYIDEFFKDDAGNKTKEVRLRIREQYDYFEGVARLILKIRGGGTTQADIEVLEAEEKEPDVIKSTQQTKESETKIGLVKGDSQADEIIRLGVDEPVTEEDISKESRVIYESKNETLKKYAILGFAILCVALAVLFAWGKLG